MDSSDLHSFEIFLERYPLEVRELARQARTLIREVMPDTIEQLDESANLIGYGTDRTYKGLICGIILYKTHVNLMLAQGASLPDPNGLLQGTGKRARHIRLASCADIEKPGVHQLLELAFQVKNKL